MFPARDFAVTVHGVNSTLSVAKDVLTKQDLNPKVHR